MALHRKLIAALALTATLAATTAAGGSASATAPTSSDLTWVCLASTQAPDRERSLRVPEKLVDLLIATTASYRGPCAERGESERFGDGVLTAYSQSVGDRPLTIGLVLSDGSLSGLPQHPPHDGTTCYDVDGDGHIDEMTECAGGHARQLDLGRQFREDVDTPFTYVLSNWNPGGHPPPDVYGDPHFDVHFYVKPDVERVAIRPGPCAHLMNCDDLELAKVMPAAEYLAPDYTDMDAIEPAMGNHLVDPTAPEFNGEPFTHTWIYGTWNGEVTFYEAMVTHEWFDRMRGGETEDACHDFKLPAQWQESGWYPTSYCLRHRDNRDEITVSLEDFVHRTAR
ncbi:hypothetical protein FB381_1280 [Nocardioides albertanoniae]|uniref:DUF5602 domain-containing protein n=1 Tax=Nocardioides albertanoniae TaxID=1175486 RepID=A0A543A4C8_9ACTN|nr:hypothetical protein [Nocardioides albertanoniae]TQL67404.1 hypothetical protein FB381_1280 [Nocardioides albertanoniae]